MYLSSVDPFCLFYILSTNQSIYNHFCFLKNQSPPIVCFFFFFQQFVYKSQQCYLIDIPLFSKCNSKFWFLFSRIVLVSKQRTKNWCFYFYFLSLWSQDKEQSSDHGTFLFFLFFFSIYVLYWKFLYIRIVQAPIYVLIIHLSIAFFQDN